MCIFSVINSCSCKHCDSMFELEPKALCHDFITSNLPECKETHIQKYKYICDVSQFNFHVYVTEHSYH